MTLSNEQKRFVDDLTKKNKISSKATIQDYRHETEKFDNIVSIEMFEAVGKKYWNDYFKKIKQCLKKEGRALIQTITIDDSIYKNYLKTSDFIREYIFPGGLLPSQNIFEIMAKNNGLNVANKFSFGQCYNKTLLKWLENFDNLGVRFIVLQFGGQVHSSTNKIINRI